MWVDFGRLRGFQKDRMDSTKLFNRSLLDLVLLDLKTGAYRILLENLYETRMLGFFSVFLAHLYGKLLEKICLKAPYYYSAPI